MTHRGWEVKLHMLITGAVIASYNLEGMCFSYSVTAVAFYMLS